MSYQIEGAVIKEQGQKFAIVVVKSYVIQNRSEAEKAQLSFGPVFPGMPIILMAQNSSSVPTYFGRTDIVKFLANIDFRRIPWKRYTVG